MTHELATQIIASTDLYKQKLKKKKPNKQKNQNRNNPQNQK